MAASGARVVVNDIGASLGGEVSADSAGAAQRVVNEIAAAGGEAVASTDSVSSWASAARIVQCALDTYGRIDGVVNNAGILRDRIFPQDDRGRLALGHLGPSRRQLLREPRRGRSHAQRRTAALSCT